MPSSLRFDWHDVHEPQGAAPAVDPRRRLRLFLAVFLLLLAAIFGRVIQLETTQGAAFREEAARPIVRRHALPGVRGRILAGDGTVLAEDRRVAALAVHYRYLEEPPNPRWLRGMARSRLSGGRRGDAETIAAEEQAVLAERRELHHRLARMCGLSETEWSRRARRIQTQVERIAKRVNRRHLAEPTVGEEVGAASGDRSAPASVTERARAFLLDVLRGSMYESPPSPITVAEELDYHVMAEDVPLSVVAEVEGRPEAFRGVRIVERSRRIYPAGDLAAHVLGHLGPIDPDELAEQAAGDDAYRADDRLGRMGVEGRYEHLLRGGWGTRVERLDRSGRILSAYREKEPGVGRDLVLTLDPPLQRSAEELLDAALNRRNVRLPAAQRAPAGGAIVVIHVRTGAVLAAASAPRFDPNLFTAGSGEALAALLDDPARPLFDRASRMAIPPGSVFKVVTAAALLETATTSPDRQFHCRGYWREPGAMRCAIYRRHGVGHGDLELAGALAQSCNVYFFEHAAAMGPEALVEWSRRFGFGRPVGIDLSGESAGTLPSPANIREIEGHDWRPADTQMLAIGQSSLQATPLQVVRMMAAVANGGRLVTPHVVSRAGLSERALQREPDSPDALDTLDEPIRHKPPQPIPGLDAHTRAAIRAGLERVVAAPEGTAHATVYTDAIAVAGKTGTAQTGGDRADHAWFAGYVPVERPKYAFVVVLEHAGDAATEAGPVAKRLVLRMQQIGHFDRP